jgi:Transglycosylase SLT domain
MSLRNVASAIRSMRRWAPAAVAACAVTAVGAAPAAVFGDSADADTVAVQPLPLGLVPPPQPAREPLAARLPGPRSGALTPTPMSEDDRISLAGRVDRATRSGIPVTALRAYVRAAETLRRADPSCGLPWHLLAAIGRVESNHGRFAGRQLLTDGRSSQPIIGLPLNGMGNVALIRDSDNGALDTDRVYDRAVGPMQFIPGTWAFVAVDGDGDGRKDPHDIDDASLAAGVYLCAGNSDLRTEAGQRAAVFRYNHSAEYVELVLALAAAYASGQSSVPVVPGRPGPLPNVGTDLPAASVGTPPGLADETVDQTPTARPGSSAPTGSAPSSSAPTSSGPTSSAPTSSAPTSSAPTSSAPTSSAPTSSAPTSSAPTSSAPTSSAPTSSAPTSSQPTSPDGSTTPTEPDPCAQSPTTPSTPTGTPTETPTPCPSPTS